jgi:hypothetical protein
MADNLDNSLGSAMWHSDTGNYKDSAISKEGQDDQVHHAGTVRMTTHQNSTTNKSSRQESNGTTVLHGTLPPTGCLHSTASNPLGPQPSKHLLGLANNSSLVAPILNRSQIHP